MANRPYLEIEGIDLSPFMQLDFEGLERGYPFVRKFYGQPLQLPEGVTEQDPYWLGYYDKDHGIARLYNLIKIIPELCRALSDQLNEKLAYLNIQTYPENARLGFTKSKVHNHVDEGSIGSINCFVKNGDAAYVNFYKDKEGKEKFETQCTETGKSYLIDTTTYHEVIHCRPETRYSITFGVFAAN